MTYPEVELPLLPPATVGPAGEETPAVTEAVDTAGPAEAGSAVTRRRNTRNDQPW